MRERQFTWIDATAQAGDARKMSGLEFLRTRPLAPVAECLDFRLEVIDEGRVSFACTPAEFHYNPIGTVHGGVISTLCDSAMGASVHSTLPLGAAYTTLELKVNFLRPVTVATGPLVCEGVVLSRGSRVATAQATLKDRDGRVYAHATSTCLILEDHGKKEAAK